MKKLYIVFALCAPITFNAFSMQTKEAKKAQKLAEAAAHAASRAAARLQAAIDMQAHTPHAVALVNQMNNDLTTISANLHHLQPHRQVINGIIARLERAPNDLDDMIQRRAIVNFVNAAVPGAPAGAPRVGQRIVARANAVLAAPGAAGNAEVDEMSRLIDLIHMAREAAFETGTPLLDDATLLTAENDLAEQR